MNQNQSDVTRDDLYRSASANLSVLSQFDQLVFLRAAHMQQITIIEEHLKKLEDEEIKKLTQLLQDANS